jgi:amino acid transporter
MILTRINNLFAGIRRLAIGEARDVRDPHVFHNLSLVAFFAWVGLGVDGLTSSCYGPEEAFLALGQHTYLAVFIALATAITIFIVTASYSQIVEQFPAGGGGYVVASKLLSPSVGLVSGCALLIDYVLTITVSIASGANALFSFLPESWQDMKLPLAVLGVGILVLLNLRGVRESVIPLTPIFLVFVATHVFVILWAISTHASGLRQMAGATMTDIHATHAEIGTLAMILLIVRAYAMGAGTYTGIEAVSNGLPILREPRVKTAKRTMKYMAISLAFMAAGLIVGYLLFDVRPVPNKTLNAVLLERISGGWDPQLAHIFVGTTLLSEAILLFAAAQTGFLDGPRVLANMAADHWFPFQFALLSNRLVIKNGILMVGVASIILMVASGGSVTFLVVLYSINVFITFCLSQLGMVRFWWTHKATQSRWRHKLLINGVGLLLTTVILASVVVVKFHEGGWITLVVTGSLMVVAIMIKRYYLATQQHIHQLDKFVRSVEVATLESTKPYTSMPVYDPTARVAVILVGGFNGMGLHTLLGVIRLFGANFKNFFFLQAGMVDTANFKGVEEIESLQNSVRAELSRYEAFVQSQGYFALGFGAVGPDMADEICTLASSIFKQYPQSVFFAGQIVFQEETFLNRLLYNHVTFTVQKRLLREGIPFIILPVKIT